MSIIDKNPVMESIADWADYKSNEIKAAYDQKGGWEGWVQVELARHLQQAFGHEGQTVVTREEYVYNGTDQRSDFLITTTKSNGDSFTNMFELKCESCRNSGKFRTDVKADCTKITNGVWNAKYNPCKAWIIAFGVTKAVGDFAVGGANLKAYHRKIQAGGTEITIWWGTRA